MDYPVVHFEINTASQSNLARFYEEAFGWTTHADGDDYLQIKTNGVCAGAAPPPAEWPPGSCSRTAAMYSSNRSRATAWAPSARMPR